MVMVLSIDTILVFYFVIKYCIEKGKIKINHIFCVSLGYMYYGLIPFWCFELQIGFNDWAYQTLLKYYAEIPYVNQVKYIINSFLMYALFVLGSRPKNNKRWIIKRKGELTIQFSEQILYPIVLLFGIFGLWLNRAYLFKGYKYEGAIENMYKGTLSAYVIMLFSITLMNYFSKKKSFNFVKRFLDKWGIIFTFFAVMLLSMGGRIYVITNVFALLVCYSCFHAKGSSIRSFSKIFLVLMLSAGLIGVIRQGGIIYLRDVLFNILAEPLYCSFSLLTYLGNNEINNWFSYPRILSSSFINLIPTVIFPDKIKYIKSVFDLGQEIRSPLGGMHYFVSFTLDFGVVGSLILVYLFGKIVKTLCQEPISSTKSTIYCLISSYLVFGIHRDPINVSIVKDIIEFSIIIPLSVSLVNKLFFTYVNKKAKNFSKRLK